MTYCQPTDRLTYHAVNFNLSRTTDVFVWLCLCDRQMDRHTYQPRSKWFQSAKLTFHSSKCTILRICGIWKGAIDLRTNSVIDTAFMCVLYINKFGYPIIRCDSCVPVAHNREFRPSLKRRHGFKDGRTNGPTDGRMDSCKDGFIQRVTSTPLDGFTTDSTDGVKLWPCSK